MLEKETIWRRLSFSEGSLTLLTGRDLSGLFPLLLQYTAGLLQAGTTYLITQGPPSCEEVNEEGMVGRAPATWQHLTSDQHSLLPLLLGIILLLFNNPFQIPVTLRY